MVRGYHFSFYVKKGSLLSFKMWLTAGWGSQAVPSVKWIGGLESSYLMGIPALKYASFSLICKLYTQNIYLLWHDISQASKGIQIPLQRDLNESLEVLFHVCLLSENKFDSLTRLYPICYIPRHDPYYCLTFSGLLCI